MTFKELKNKIKEEQKQLALKIRRGKFLRKPKNRVGMTDEDRHLYFYRYDQYKEAFFNGSYAMSGDYRARHIAYCMFFNNTPYGMIEKPREDADYSKTLAISRSKDFIKKWKSEIDEETVRSSAA